MSLKTIAKRTLIWLRWGRMRKRFHSISAIYGLNHSGTIVCPERISIGENYTIAKGFVLHVFPEGDQRVQLRIGDNFWARNNLSIMCGDSVTIGNNVTIARDIFITDLNHGTDPTTPNFRLNPSETAPVVIGDGVWLGEKVCVLPGVHIGEKTIIGAGSVVTKDIPAYSIAAGNPCRVIKCWNHEKGHWEKA